MALALGKNRDQHICARHFFATGGLNVNHRALDDALKAGSRLGIVASLGNEIVEFRINVIAQRLAQCVDINRAGPQNGCGILILDQAQQQMLQRGIFVVALIGRRECAVKRLFEITGEMRAWCSTSISFP